MNVIETIEFLRSNSLTFSGFRRADGSACARCGRAASSVAATLTTTQASPCRLPYAGHDGTTGETLLKSVLAPMFAMRHLAVRSWSGINLLGGDGATLADPAANAAKVRSKQRVLGETLGYLPQSGTRIEYVENLGHFNTAWDLVTFAGFLGRDAAGVHLARLRLGAGRPLVLAFFFEDPLGAAGGSLAERVNKPWRTGPLNEFLNRSPAYTLPGTGRRRPP